MAIEASALSRHWVHSREEDGPGVTVYRPQGYPFPPARGRKQLELDAAGHFVAHGYGPADKRGSGERGSWRLDGDQLVLTPSSGGERRQRVALVTSEVLELASA